MEVLKRGRSRTTKEYQEANYGVPLAPSGGELTTR